MLYYLGAMQALILKISWLMQKTLGTSAGESVNAAGNIFVGMVIVDTIQLHDIATANLSDWNLTLYHWWFAVFITCRIRFDFSSISTFGKLQPSISASIPHRF